MIKRITPSTEPDDQSKAVKTLDGITSSDDDDTFYQGTGQNVTPATAPVVETTMTSTAPAVVQQDNAPATIVTTPSTQYASTVTGGNITSNVDAVLNLVAF